MKNNKGIYFLLPLVLIVWAIIGYRIVKYLSQDKVAQIATKTAKINFQSDNLAQDSFTIKANYRDPFLGEIRKEPRINPVAITTKPVAPPPVIKNSAPWPTLSFHGIVKNTTSNKTYGLITINGKVKSVTESDQLSGITVISIQRDSITVIFNAEKKSFRKNKKA